MGEMLTHLAVHTNGITATEKMVLIVLGDYADDATGLCSLSQQSVAEICELSRKSVNASVGNLAKLGFVEIMSYDGYPSTYRVNLTSDAAPHAAKGAASE